MTQITDAMLVDTIEILEAAARNETLNRRVRNRAAEMIPVYRQVAAARMRARTRLDEEALAKDAERTPNTPWVPPPHPEKPLRRVKPLGDGIFTVTAADMDTDDLMSKLGL